jgi:coenzyme F420-0:L-glutamate ligase/coenzyme F420-1:gamma-L-glutamate ligase
MMPAPLFTNHHQQRSCSKPGPAIPPGRAAKTEDMGEPDLALYRLDGIPLIEPGDDLAAVILAALEQTGLRLQPGDVLAVAQKIVSKAEDRRVRLAGIQVSARARALAEETGKDPRMVELILRESRRVVRQRPGLIIVEHRLGMVLANAGIDRSNVAGDEDTVLLLPADPDASAHRLREAIHARCGIVPGVLIADSIGRPWRLGTSGVAIGAAGICVLQDLRGSPDLFAREMQVAEIAPADSLAAAAVLLMGEGAEGTPVVLVRGVPPAPDQPAAAVLRASHEDLFQ